MYINQIKNRIGISALSVCVAFTVACAKKEQQDPEQFTLETNEQRVSYVVGYSIAEQIQSAGLKVDNDALNKAINDVANGEDIALSSEQMRSAGSIFQNLVREKKLAEARQATIEAGAKFLTENASKEGVVTTPSGLQYSVIESGDGKSPGVSDQVSVHYRGTLLDGTVFDSSLDNSSESLSESNAPVEFVVNQVIPGWVEVLQLMQEGDKWKVWVPHSLAYPNGTQTIPSGSTLAFDIELIEVK